MQQVGDVCVGEINPLEMAVKQSKQDMGRAEVARATVNQVKVEGIDTNIAIMQVLDACSAPGNKTVHLVALMRGEGKIIACELDKERVKQLECTTKQAGATNVEVLHEDFLKLSPVDLSYSKDKIIGILDWELSTLGNQMCDVAFSTLHYYAKFQL